MSHQQPWRWTDEGGRVRHDDRRVVLGLYRTGLSRQLLESAFDIGVTAIDTAYSYDQFTSHRALSAIADDLLSTLREK